MEIEIKLPRCLLILTEDEMLSMLKLKPDVWSEALQRGKAHIRRKQALIRAERRTIAHEEDPRR